MVLELFDFGIRGHSTPRGGFFSPPASWNRGPFMTLFQTDFRAGVAVLNRLLNHAAKIRVRTLTHPDQMSYSSEDMDFGLYQADLEITGTRRPYLGDEHVWMWYRGTGVAPYPCMSALQALELRCDQLVNQRVPIGKLISLLLDGCENLAMVGLVVGMLVRHLEVAENFLDPYLTEALIWNYEFRRVAKEHSILAASSEAIEAPQRRSWTLREAAMFLALRATDNRVADLQDLGQTLVEKARIKIEKAHYAGATEEEGIDGEDLNPLLARVRAWATSFDRSKFQVRETPEGMRIQPVPPKEVVQAMHPGNEDLKRAEEGIRLTYRYFIKPIEGNCEPIEPDELTTDAASARRLLEEPPSLGVYHPEDVAGLVAAAVLDNNLLLGVDVPVDTLAFAVDTVLRASEGGSSPRPFEFEETYFEEGADRSAARVLPLLLLPSAAHLRAIVEGGDGLTTFNRVSDAGLNTARAIPNEVRIHLARGLDHLWEDTVCTGRSLPSPGGVENRHRDNARLCDR